MKNLHIFEQVKVKGLIEQALTLLAPPPEDKYISLEFTDGEIPGELQLTSRLMDCVSDKEVEEDFSS